MDLNSLLIGVMIGLLLFPILVIWLIAEVSKNERK